LLYFILGASCFSFLINSFRCFFILLFFFLHIVELLLYAFYSVKNGEVIDFLWLICFGGLLVCCWVFTSAEKAPYL
jgi:hypothetical protein